MAAASSPNPMNLLVLAAVGIGVFWLMSRQRAQPLMPVVYPTPAQNQQALQQSNNDALKYQLTAGLIGKAFDFFGARASGQNPYSLATGYGTGMADGWGVPLHNDGVAYNPGGNVGAQDSIYSLASAWKS